MDAYWAAPPFARSLATGILAVSIPAHFGFLSFHWLYFTEDTLLRLPPEIWRLVTSFLLCGPGISLIMDPYFGRGTPFTLARSATGVV